MINFPTPTPLEMYTTVAMFGSLGFMFLAFGISSLIKAFKRRGYDYDL